MIRLILLLVLTTQLVAQVPSNNIKYVAKLSKEKDNDVLERIKYLNFWVAKNIHYDETLDYSKLIASNFTYKDEQERLRKLEALDVKLANFTIAEEKAVCHGYAALLKTLLKSIDIKARIMTGYAHTDPSMIGKQVEANHAWIEFSYNNNWNFIDPTWSAGYKDIYTGEYVYAFQPIYFMMNKKRWKLTHYPTKPNEVITINKPVYYKKYFEADLHINNTIPGILESGSTYYLQVDGIEEKNTIYFQNESRSGRLQRLNRRYTIPPLKKGILYLFYQNEVIMAFKVK